MDPDWGLVREVYPHYNNSNNDSMDYYCADCGKNHVENCN